MARRTNLEKLKVLRYNNRLLYKEICRLSLVNSGLEARVARLELTKPRKPISKKPSRAMKSRKTGDRMSIVMDEPLDPLSAAELLRKVNR
jgi:hypothetical protein